MKGEGGLLLFSFFSSEHSVSRDCFRVGGHSMELVSEYDEHEKAHH